MLVSLLFRSSPLHRGCGHSSVAEWPGSAASPVSWLTVFSSLSRCAPRSSIQLPHSAASTGLPLSGSPSSVAWLPLTHLSKVSLPARSSAMPLFPSPNLSRILKTSFSSKPLHAVRNGVVMVGVVLTLCCSPCRFCFLHCPSACHNVGAQGLI